MWAAASSSILGSVRINGVVWKIGVVSINDHKAIIEMETSCLSYLLTYLHTYLCRNEPYTCKYFFKCSVTILR